MRRNSRLALGALLALSLVLAACEEEGPPATTSTVPPTATPTATPTPEPAISASTISELRETGSFNAAQVQRMLWSAEGDLWVASTTRIDTVAPDSGVMTNVLEVQAPERILAVSPDGLAAVASGATVQLVEVDTGQAVHTLEPGGITNAASFFESGIVLVSGDVIEASTWDIDTGEQVGTLSGFQTAAPVFNVVVSPDGATSAWVSRATVQFGDVEANTLGPRLQFEDFVGTYLFAPDGSFATAIGAPGAGNALTGRVQLWDTETGDEVQSFDQPSLVTAMAFAPDEPLLATGGEGVTFWSTDDGTEAGGLPAAEAGNVRQLAFSDDGTALATLAEDGTGKIWRATSP